MLKNKLADLGLSDNEIKIYLYLLEHGNSTIRELMSKTGLSVTRQTIYNLINQLADKGLVTFNHRSKTRYIETTPPNSLRSYIDKRQQELDQHKNQITALINELELHKDSKRKDRAVIEIFEGEEVFSALIKYVYDIKDHTSIKTVYLPDEDKDVIWGERTVSSFRKKRTAKNITVTGLHAIDPKNISAKMRDRIKNSDKDIDGVQNRFLPRTEFPFDVEIGIFNEYIAILNMSSKPLHLVVIKDKSIRRTIESLFLGTWENAKGYTDMMREKLIAEDAKK